MYISPDVRPNPPPTTIDGKYVADHLGNALTLALSDISERRPWDPIEYLANWLYKYQANIDYNKHVSTLIQTTNITNHAYSMYRVMITHSTWNTNRSLEYFIMMFQNLTDELRNNLTKSKHVKAKCNTVKWGIVNQVH